jgi:hypothetical protein
MTARVTYLTMTPDEFLRMRGGTQPDGRHDGYSVIGVPLEWEETARWEGAQETRREVRVRKITKLLVQHYELIPDPPKLLEDE